MPFTTASTTTSNTPVHPSKSQAHAFAQLAPASAPVTPAYRQPATPQRIPRTQRHQAQHQNQHPQHQMQNVFHDHHPATPGTSASVLSTPFTTPLSRGSWSPSSSAALNTPGSLGQQSFALQFTPGKGDELDWRERASENGIRVGDFADDDGNDQAFPDMSNVSGAGLFLHNQGHDALLQPAFLQAQRRARSHTVVHQAPQTAPRALASQGPHTPARRTLQALNTPPPRPADVSRLKLKGSLSDPAYPRRRPAFGQTPTNLFDIDEDEFTPYPSSFSPSQPRTHSLALNDPFDSPAPSFGFGFTQDTFQPLPAAFPCMPVSPPKSASEDDTSTCTVCGLAPTSLAVLEPCKHILCSACLTSALNIVGEKDMECAVCKKGVDDFKLRSAAKTNPKGGASEFGAMMDRFDLFDLGGGVPRASTPVGARRQASASGRPGEVPVLRIDNVPWDITPPAIRAWLKHPVKHVHVLLDRKGKTLSHAYAEMADEDAARAALRTAQNSVLGRGRRARGVTVTRSGQAELMRALFPGWRGAFDGARPVVQGKGTAEGALLGETELKALLHLIRAPDSHFVKVPTLPFHSLVGILVKFPADMESRAAWSPATRDMLFDVTMTALQTLMSNKTEKALASEPDLLMQVLQAAMHCEAFTREQVSRLAEFAEHVPVVSPPSSASSRLQTPDSASASTSSAVNVYGPYQPPSQGPAQNMQGPYDVLAREFGIETHLVEALAQRISGMV
ncbi:hypothetical protein DENSPDRAFT_285976 [Dentipellis sp. KUC8613]|nr:hypothetical protein DENSPDRAFT_285976 [Dentipellis sp. KUC8613]